MKPIVLFTLVFAASAMAQDKPKPASAPKPADPDGIIGLGNFDDALKEAKARNVPIHFALHKDN